MRQMKGNCVYLPIDSKTFSQYTLQTIIFPTSKSKRASYNTWTNEISRYKSQDQVQICGKRQWASGRRKDPPKSLEDFEMSKVRWKQKKSSKHLLFCKERTSRWMPLCLIALESNVNLPDLAAREDGWGWIAYRALWSFAG